MEVQGGVEKETSRRKSREEILQNLHFAPKYQCYALNQLETNWNKKFVWRAKIPVKAKIISHITTRLVLIITLCLLSHFSHVRLFASPWTVACQAPLSMGLSRQEHWNGLPFPSSAIKYEVSEGSEVKSLSHVQLFATPWTACSLPGSSIHGIFQARVLEGVAIIYFLHKQELEGDMLIVWLYNLGTTNK